jgi:RimK family alpha-L-glutamate ligase
MKFLVVGLLKGSQITRLGEEAKAAGHEVFGCRTDELTIRSSGEVFEPFVRNKKLSDFDLVYLCAGVESKKRYEWYVACDFLRNHTRTQIVNEVAAITGGEYYPLQTWFYLKLFEEGIPQPYTYTIYNFDELRIAGKSLKFPMVLKFSETHQGKGIFLVKSLRDVKNVISQHPGQTYLLREFIPSNGDIRIFVVGEKAIGAMRRTPRVGEFRSNISVGGKGEKLDLAANGSIRELAEKSAKATGIEVAGVDIIINKKTGQHYVLEVNTGPQFNGLERYTGTNVASEIVKYFVKKCQNK